MAANSNTTECNTAVAAAAFASTAAIARTTAVATTAGNTTATPENVFAVATSTTT